MATSSEVKAGLDAIAEAISKNRARIVTCVATAGEVSTALGALATTYAAVVATINGYGTTDAFEALSKAELAKMVTEYNALKADADAIAATDLG
jgi:2,4-dienoyl-CoA reductase-like NADH-dependent reductase (Old Yellow Enzyme family)